MIWKVTYADDQGVEFVYLVEGDLRRDALRRVREQIGSQCSGGSFAAVAFTAQLPYFLYKYNRKTGEMDFG